MLEKTLLSQCGSDRATEYNNNSKIIRLGDRLLVGWLDAPEGAVGPTRLRLGVCSAQSGSLQAKHLMGEAWDNHCGPALALDADKRLHVMLGGHNTPFRYIWTDYFTSTAPPVEDGTCGQDMIRWNPAVEIGPKATYPSLVVDVAGTLHLVYRESAERGQLCYRRKPKGRDWEAPRCLAVSPVEGYTNFLHSISTGPNGDLHLLFQFHYALPDDKRIPGRFSAYLSSEDGGDTWQNEGEKCQFPLTPDTTRFFRSYPEGGLRISAGHVVDSQNRPWLHVTTPDQIGGALLRRDASGWTEIDTSATLGKLNLQDGGGRGVTISRSHSGHIHLVVATHPDATPGSWYDPRHELFHLVLTEEGKTVSFKQITETDRLTASWLPAMEKWDWTRRDECCIGSPWLIYTRGLNLGNAWGSFRNSLRTEVYLARPS